MVQCRVAILGIQNIVLGQDSLYSQSGSFGDVACRGILSNVASHGIQQKIVE